MRKVLLRRLLISIPLLVAVSFGVFTLLHFAPGDPAAKVAGSEASEEQIEAVREQFGFDDPFLTRYVRWLGDAVQGDLGSSLSVSNRPVVPEIRSRLGATLSLAGMALVMGVAVGTVAGVLSARRPNGIVDRISAVGSSLAVATPNFLIGLLLVVPFAIERAWLPATGYAPLSEGVGEWFRHLLIPAASLAALPAAETARQLRESLLQSLDRDYILAARAKGVRPRVVLLKHALKNAAIAPVTVLGFRFAQLVGGAVVIERLFIIDGLGSLAVEAVSNQDQTMVLGVTVFCTALVLVTNVLVDVTYLYFNPKLRAR
ncbi:MAG: ABC transporter permease [Acidimicrobiia bacterium]